MKIMNTTLYVINIILLRIKQILYIIFEGYSNILKVFLKQKEVFKD